jgi:DNA-binding CsgD family transcriptional regulator
VLVAELRHRAARLSRENLEIDGICLEFDRLFRSVLLYRVAAWSTLDPASGLFTSCTMTGIEKDTEREARLFSFEFCDGEPSTFLSMIELNQSVAILSRVTEGRLERARRYREFLAGFGVVDELRAVLRAGGTGGTVWGGVTLYRSEGLFTSADAELVETAAPYAATAFQLAMLRAVAARPGAVEDPPGILHVDTAGRVSGATDPGDRWLQLGGQELVTAVNVVAAAVREDQDRVQATSRLRLPDGRFARLHAAHLHPGTGDVAVIVDVARPADVGSILMDAYGLTDRQRHVLGRILLGHSIAEIAGDLGISEHTANDHRKAIYERLQVSSRAELAALLQAEHYNPRSHSGVAPSPYGGFLPP